MNDKISKKLNKSIDKLDVNNRKIVDLGNLKIYSLIWKQIISNIPTNSYIKDGNITVLYVKNKCWDLAKGLKIGTRIKEKAVNTKFNSCELCDMLLSDGLQCCLTDQGLVVIYNESILRNINANYNPKASDIDYGFQGKEKTR